MDAIDRETDPQRRRARVSRIVVLDGATLDPGDNPFDALRDDGELAVHDRTPAGLIRERAQGAEVLLTNKVVLDAATLEALPSLRLVCVTATGVNVVDLTAASRLGITVCNVPGYGADSVAQHAIALMLEATNAVGEHSQAVRRGDWAGSPDFSFWRRPLVELAGRTIGVVGYGRIGSRVAAIAHALGMQVLACRAGRGGERPFDGFDWATAGEIFARCDVVTLHCPLTPDNRRFVSTGLLSSMKSGSILVNTARGDLVDEEALARALDAGRPAFAVLDVLSVEPPPADHPLASHPRAIVTPHLAWATVEARRRLMAITVENVRAWAAGRPQNVVS